MQIDPARLGDVRTSIESLDNELLLSAASSWEIAIKSALGKLNLPEPPEVYVPSRMKRSGVDALPIQHSHALRVASLPAHHRDPFDRLLVAQAALEGLSLVSADPVFDLYDVNLIRPKGSVR